MDRTTLSRPLADVLATLDPGEADAAYDHLGLAALTDHALVSACAAVIDRPKAAPPDSFVLHAPLELMARAGLLARVGPDARDAARRSLVWFAATYAAAGPSVDEPDAASLLEAGLAEAVGGSYIRLSLNSDTRINPFDLPRVIDSDDAAPSWRLAKSLFCVPRGVSANQLRGTFLAYLRAHPEEEDLNAAILVGNAFISSFPCD